METILTQNYYQIESKSNMDLASTSIRSDDRPRLLHLSTHKEHTPSRTAPFEWLNWETTRSPPIPHQSLSSGWVACAGCQRAWGGRRNMDAITHCLNFSIWTYVCVWCVGSSPIGYCLSLRTFQSHHWNADYTYFVWNHLVVHVYRIFVYVCIPHILTQLLCRHDHLIAVKGVN